MTLLLDINKASTCLCKLALTVKMCLVYLLDVLPKIKLLTDELHTFRVPLYILGLIRKDVFTP